jgi:predicted HAD superfamily Cof-like phosphohydrolase
MHRYFQQQLRSPHQQRVCMMMNWFNQATPLVPVVPEDKVVKLRVALPLEETFELAEASGYEVRLNGQKVNYEDLELVRVGEPYMEDVIDAFGDISVVTVGGLAAYGVADTPVLEAIDENNLLKKAGGRENPVTGKFEKSPDHKPPDINAVLLNLSRIGRVQLEKSSLR